VIRICEYRTLIRSPDFGGVQEDILAILLANSLKLKTSIGYSLGAELTGLQGVVAKKVIPVLFMPPVKTIKKISPLNKIMKQY
jgi:hypothetical protein